MKKIFAIVTAILFVLTSCESGDFIGGRYFGTFKNESNQKIESGNLSFEWGSLIHYELIDNPVHIMDSTLISIDTTMIIDSLSTPGVIDTSYSYHYNYSYSDSTIHNYATIPLDTLKGLFLLNNLVEMHKINPKFFTSTVSHRDSITLLLKTIPALYNIQLCDSTVVLDQVTKKIEIDAEFKGNSVQSSFNFTFNNEETKKVTFVGHDR